MTFARGLVDNDEAPQEKSRSCLVSLESLLSVQVDTETSVLLATGMSKENGTAFAEPTIPIFITKYTIAKCKE